MAAIISYQIKFPGLDEELIKLREANRLLDSISRNGGIGASARYNGSSVRNGGNTNIIPLGGAVGGAGIEDAAIAGAAAGTISSNRSRNLFTDAAQQVQLGLKSSQDKLKDSMVELRVTMMKLQQSQFGTKGSTSNVTPEDIALSHKIQQLQFGKPKPAGEFYNYYRGPIPPVVPPPYASKYSNTIEPQIPAYGGLFQGLKNKFITNWRLKNKEENEGGSWGGILQGAGGRIGGGGGKILSGLGGLFNSFGPLKVITIGLAAAMYALHKAVQLLEKGIQHGAEAYQRAARFGNNIGNQFSIDNAFKTIGMETPDLSMLQGQFNRQAQRFDIPGSEQILGAARAGQFGNAQQLVNLSKEFSYSMRDAASSAREMANASKATMIMSMEIAHIAREWKTLQTQIAALYYNQVRGLELTFKWFLQGLNLIMGRIINILQMAHLIPKNIGNNFSKIPGGLGGTPTQGAWEKMGFVFSSSRNTIDKAIHETANNTKETVSAVNKLGAILIGLYTARNVTFPSLPSLP